MTPRRVGFPNPLRKAAALAMSWLSMASSVWAQASSTPGAGTGIEPVRPQTSILTRPYRAPEVPPARLADSTRLRGLIRAGMLYLTVQDAIALALENNLDIEVARYNPILSEWNLERSEAGGALPGVPGGASQAGSVASGQGVAGSQAAAGVSVPGLAGGGGGSTNASVTQVGPITQVLDPLIQETSTFSHVTTPEPNVVVSGIPALASNSRVQTATIQQGLLTGGTVSLSYSDHYLKENSPSDVLNPSSAPSLSLTVQHNVLRGLGRAVNGRTINISKLNLATSALNFKTQVTGIVVNVLNLYYGLVADLEDVKAKRSALEVAQQFFEDNQAREKLGVVSGLDVTNSEAQAATAQANLVVSETALLQQEVALKNVLSRRGLADPDLANARIMPLDQIVVPPADDIAPVDELVKQALADRADLAAARANITSAEISALGTKSGILPSVQVIAATSQVGLAGTRVAPAGSPGSPNPYFVGGIGNALGQAFRRDFPTERVGAFGQVSIGNRQAQADFGIDQLQLRQTQLSTQKTMNQVVVDVSNYVIALRQARTRHQAAVENRILNEQLLDGEQRKLVLGASTPYNVILQQRDLAAARSSEVATLAAYINSRIALDQAVGATLEANHVTIDEARAGVVQSAGQSAAPRQ
jgi:outer membrane protein